MLNKKTLADSIGVEPHTIIRWEGCHTVPTDENVDALVRVLDYPKAFFFGPDIDEPGENNTSFRSQTTMSAAIRDAALAAGALGLVENGRRVNRRLERTHFKAFNDDTRDILKALKNAEKNPGDYNLFFNNSFEAPYRDLGLPHDPPPSQEDMQMRLNMMIL